jgi:signal transduction histidine kinase
LLSTLKLYFHALNSNKYSDADKTRMHENIDNIIEELINTTRSISNNLMPHILNDFGLDAALKVFIDKINEAGLVKIKYDHENESVQLKKDFEIILYRTISELINNTLKYANAQNIAIRISISEGFVEVFYEDDGKGFDVEKHLTKQSSSLGLKSLIYRIKSHDGQIHFTSEPGKGFRTNISLPIYKQLEKERHD